MCDQMSGFVSEWADNVLSEGVLFPDLGGTSATAFRYGGASLRIRGEA